MNIYLTTLLILLGSFSISFGQSLEESRESSYNTYIYKISDKEALKIYKKGEWELGLAYLHTIVDSFQTDSTYRKSLPDGHYIFVHALQNKVILSLEEVSPINIFLQDNKVDLAVEVRDKKGNKISDAQVWLKNESIPFDNQSQAYLKTKD